MIPTIGLMVAAQGIVVCLYVLVRCGDLVVNRPDTESGIVQLIAVVTGLTALLAIALTVVLAISLTQTGTG